MPTERHINKYQNNSAQFSLETYFVWLCALIFITEVITGKLFIIYSFNNFLFRKKKNYITSKFNCLQNLFLDVGLVWNYFSRNQIEWGYITMGIILFPAVLSQLYSYVLIRSEVSISVCSCQCILHIFMLGIPYRLDSFFLLL